MTRRSRSRLLLLAATSIAAVGALVAACAPAAPEPVVSGRAIPLTRDAGPPAPPFVTPSRWSLAYSPRWRPQTSVTVGDGVTLWVGEGGERWLQRSSGIEAAATLLPERIVGVQRADAGYRFVGESGAVYLAREALGGARRVSDAVPGARSIAIGKSAIVIATHEGDLVRSADAGHTWTKVKLPQSDGIAVSVAMNGAAGIVLAAPQRIYGTKDDGLTWSPVKSPAIGATRVTSHDGAVWLEGDGDNLRFDPAWGTFSAATSAHHAGTVNLVAHDDHSVTTTSRYLDGKRALEIDGTPSHEWTVAVGELGAMPAPRPLPELVGCEFVNGAIRGNTVVLSCDARGTVADGIDRDASAPHTYYNTGARSSGAPDGGTLGFVTKIYRSDDGGRTYRDDATVEGGIPQANDQAIALGGGDWLYLGMRCGTGYSPACLPARVRPNRANGWTELPQGDRRAGNVRFAGSVLDTSVYSIGVRDEEAYLFQWKAGAGAPEPLGRIAGSLEARAVSLSIDDDGAVRGFVRGDGKPHGFVYRQGQGMSTLDLPAEATRAAFSGARGIAIDRRGKTFETDDSGKTWVPAAFPAFVTDIDQCTTFGCTTNRGFRVGWDMAAPPPAASQPAPSLLYAKPLRCSAKDKWVTLGGGTIPRVASVDHGASRWVMPVRGKDGRITLLLSKRGDPTTKTTSLSMMGPAPGPPLHGSGTTMHVQPEGVVVLRYSYLRKRTGLGRYNPVDAQIAWYRDTTGKVGHGKALGNPAFRVNRDPQDGYDAEVPAYRRMPEVLSLQPNGVYFHSRAYSDEEADDDEPAKPAPFVLLRDNGRTEKLKFPKADDDGMTMVAPLDGSPDVLVANDQVWSLYRPNGAKAIRWAVMGGLEDDDAPVNLVSLGGKPVLVATARDAGRAWGIRLGATPDLGPIFALPTQKSLGDQPTPCDGAVPHDPSVLRFDAPWVVGSRHPVIVDVDGVAHVLATDRAEVRGSATKPGACVAAFDATLPSGVDDDDDDWGALVFMDDLAHSLIFRADTTDWPAQVSVRPMECQFTAGPLPRSLQDAPGFTSVASKNLGGIPVVRPLRR